MKQYEVDFSFRMPEWGSVILEAVDKDEAEEFALEHVREAYPDATNIDIDDVKEITVG